MSSIALPLPNNRKFRILDLLKNLRSAMLRSSIAVVITTAASFVFAKQIFGFFTSLAPGMTFYNYEVAGMITTYFQVCLYAGIVLALPYITFELLWLIRPALDPRARSYLFVTGIAVVALFAVGFLYTSYIFIPPAFDIVFADWGMGSVPKVTILSYVQFVSISILIHGLFFEIPVLIYYLAKLRIVHPRTLLKHWRWAVLGSVIIAAVTTPTGNPLHQKFADIFWMDTGFIASIPIICLYFSSVFIIWLVQRHDKPAPVPPD